MVSLPSAWTLTSSASVSQAFARLRDELRAVGVEIAGEQDEVGAGKGREIAGYGVALAVEHDRTGDRADLLEHDVAVQRAIRVQPEDAVGLKA